jgi:aspartate/methionine/tyrosine aminotransferase
MTERFKPFRFSRAGLRGLKVSATLSLNEHVREMWDTGRDVYHLGFGESRFPVHPKIAEALKANVQRRSYLPALGMRELRETIANYYQEKFQMIVSPDRVVIGPGSKSLLYALLLALGEEIILQQPSWVSYAPQAHLLGKPVTWIPTRTEANYNLEIDILEQKIAESQQNWGNPEVLIVNSPQNPTGTMMTPETIEDLADFARDQGLMVLSDEIYALITHGQIPHASIAQFYPEGTVVLGGLSKHLSLGGWRFGVAILPPGRAGKALAHALQNIASSIWSCVTAPVQYAALVAYSCDPEIDEYIALCARLHGIRTRYLYDVLDELGVPCVEPTGTFYIFPSFKKWREPLAVRGVHTSEDLAMYLLENYELVTLPGTAFNCSPKYLCLRLSSSYIDAGTDKKANKLLKAFGKDPDPERFIENHHPRMHTIASRFADFINDLNKG